MYNSFQRNLFVVSILFVVCAFLLLTHTRAHAKSSDYVVTVLQQTDHQYGFGKNMKSFPIYNPVGYGIVTSISGSYSIAQVHIQCIDGAEQCTKQKYVIRSGAHVQPDTKKQNRFTVDARRCAPLPKTISGDSISCTFLINTKNIPVAPIGRQSNTVSAIIEGKTLQGTLNGSDVHFHKPIIDEDAGAILITIGLPVFNDQGAVIGLLRDDPTVCPFDQRCQILPITFVARSARPPGVPQQQATVNRTKAIDTIKHTSASVVRTRITQMRDKCKKNRNYIKNYVLASSSCTLIERNTSIHLLRPNNAEDVRYAETIVKFMTLIKVAP